MKVCFYAINGHGLGHLNRSHAIAKRLRSLLEMIGEEADIQFLTTSQADYLVKDFPVFKIPSRASFKGKKAASSRYLSNGKMMVSSILSHFSPHLLVMDTVASGSFNEFHFVKSFAQRTALIERHKNDAYTESDLHQSHLGLFDSIIVPEELKYKDDYSIPVELTKKTHFVGRVYGVDPIEQWDRGRTREYFGSGEKPLIYVAAGGGGDNAAQEQLSTILDALKNMNCKVVMGYGPLNPEEKPYGNDQAIVFTEINVAKFFKGFDFAISAAGYNTYEELLFSKVPTAFFAQEKGMDDQERRVIHGLKEQWHYQLDLNGDIEEQMKGFLQEKQIPEGLRDRDSSNGAIAAAEVMAQQFFANNEEKLISIRLAAIAVDMLERQVWCSLKPVSDFHVLTRFMNTMPVSQKLDVMMETYSDHENGLEAKLFLSILSECSKFSEKVRENSEGEILEEKRQINRILKEVKGEISALKEWNNNEQHQTNVD